MIDRSDAALSATHRAICGLVQKFHWKSVRIDSFNSRNGLFVQILSMELARQFVG